MTSNSPCANVRGGRGTPSVRGGRCPPEFRAPLSFSSRYSLQLSVLDLEDSLQALAHHTVWRRGTGGHTDRHRAWWEEAVHHLQAFLVHRLLHRGGERLMLNAVAQLAIRATEAKQRIDVVAWHALLLANLNQVRRVGRVEATEHEQHVHLCGCSLRGGRPPLELILLGLR